MGKGSVVARRMREARQLAGLSQRAVGIGAGIDASTASTRINQYERGKHRPGLRTVERIAIYLSIPTPYFYAESDRLAAWILAFSTVEPGLHDAVLQDAADRRRDAPVRPLSKS
jgi:transcriptional regulator with XRE-family HTH domain